MIVVLHGADELGKHRHIAALKERVGQTRDEIQTNTATFEARDAKPAEILTTAMVPPFLGANRLVVVEGLLDRYESQGTGARGPRGLGPFESFVDTVTVGLPPTTILVITGGKLDQRRRKNPLLERLKEVPDCEIVEYPELKGASLERHIREEAGLRGIKLRPGPSTRTYSEGEEWRRPTIADPVKLLAELHPGDTLSISNELDKLALYTRGREATVDDIAVICAGEREYTIFQLTDAVMDGDYRLAMSAYKALSDAGESGQGILALLVGAYRRIAPVAELIEARAPDDAIAAASPVGRFPSLLKQAKARAQRHGVAGIVAAYEALVGTDRSIKSGEIPEEIAMELLVARLCDIAPLRRRASRQGQRANAP